MLFNSFSFLVFMPTVFVLYLSLQRNLALQNTFLLAASYIFYGFWDWRFLSLLLGTTIVVYFSTLAIGRAENPRHKKLLLILPITILLAVLGVFKYLNFFVDSFEQLFALFGMQVSWFEANLLLPVGISFFTFQSIGYVIDVYRGQTKATRNFVDCAIYVSFFPLILAGPIERSTRLLPQITSQRSVNIEKITRGSFLILIGLFKKIVIADGLSQSIDPVFGGYGGFSGWDILAACYLYTLQMYCDFSGYSDIARGVARLLGFDVMKNFKTPFYAKSPSEYWTRWHISLSSWVKDYVHLPLALHFMRKGPARINEAQPHIYSMLLMGLWHGAAWTYILWGLYHGIMLVIWSLLKLPKSLKKHRLPGFVQIIFYFHITLVSLLIFRAASVAQIGEFMAAMLAPGPFSLGIERPAFATIVAIPLFLAFDFLAFRHRSERFYLTWHPVFRGALYAVVLVLLLMGLTNASTEFIYFQF